MITDVAPNSAAAERGLKPGDVIMEVQQNEVGAPADIQKQIDAARKADRKNVLMLIQREGGVQYVPLSLSKSRRQGQAAGLGAGDRVVAADAKFVAIRIAEIRAVVVRMIVRA